MPVLFLSSPDNPHAKPTPVGNQILWYTPLYEDRVIGVTERWWHNRAIALVWDDLTQRPKWLRLAKFESCLLPVPDAPADIRQKCIDWLKERKPFPVGRNVFVTNENKKRTVGPFETGSKTTAPLVALRARGKFGVILTEQGKLRSIFMSLAIMETAGQVGPPDTGAEWAMRSSYGISRRQLLNGSTHCPACLEVIPYGSNVAFARGIGSFHGKCWAQFEPLPTNQATWRVDFAEKELRRTGEVWLINHNGKPTYVKALRPGRTVFRNFGEEWIGKNSGILRWAIVRESSKEEFEAWQRFNAAERLR